MILAAAAWPWAALAQAPPAPMAAVWSFGKDGQTPTETGKFSAKVIAPGSSVALADFGSDGVAEILVGSAPGQPPKVSMLRGDGSVIMSFAPFEKSMASGVNVAAADVDGDKFADIVAGSGPGAAGQVNIFDRRGKPKGPAGGLTPYGPDFKGGVFVTAADLDGDGKAEIITGAGPGGGPHVRIYGFDGKLRGHFFAFDAGSRNGVSVAAGDLDGDGRTEIAAALPAGGDGLVKVFDGRTLAERVAFKAYDENFSGGLALAAADIDADSKAEIIAASALGGEPRIRVFDAAGAFKKEFLSHESGSSGGLAVAAGRLAKSGPAAFVAVPQAADAAKAAYAKYIDVAVTEQRLRAYEYGRLINTFLVSTGKKNTPTPVGTFSITAKPYKVHYRGPGYDLGVVPWNLRFQPSIYIHYAPWHNNFGQRMSHGCVNVNKASAEWIYEWAEVGTPVAVRE